jgi:hypothetical protein
MQLLSRGQKILTAVGIIAVVNFTAFFVIALCLGGDAINGRVENGVYFLSSHGKATEVDRGVYIYSYIHAVSVWITHASVFLALLVLKWTGQFKRGPN